LIDTFRKSLELLRREHRGRWVFLVCLAAAASALEMVGALLVYVLLALVADPGSAIDLPMIGDVRSALNRFDDQQVLLLVAGVVAGFFLARAVFQTFVAYAQQRIAHNAGARLSRRLAGAYLSAPYEFHLRRATSDLIRTGHQAVIDVVNRAFLPLINVTASALLVLGMLILMMIIAPVATVMAVVVIGTAAAILLRVVQPRLRDAGQSTYAETGNTLQALQQALQGIRDIKLLGREKHFVDRYGESRDRLSRAFFTYGTLGELPRHVMETSLVLFILIFFGIALLAGAATDEIVSILGLFAYAGLRLQPSLNRMVGGINELKYASASIDAIDSDLRLAETFSSTPQGTSRLALRRELRMEDVTFRYGGADRSAVTRLNLTVRRGEVIGICGPTGGGKSTLADLMTGLLDPTFGRVTIDGQDLRDHVREWQRNLGIVSQSIFLIDDSLRHNIALGVSAPAIDDEALQHAVDLAQLRTFVESLPSGLETTVGEAGVRLSGGQRQRVAIARALYHEPDVLLFDEGTSALDNTTEAQLMDSLSRLRGEHTIILVAHRLSTVRECDRIVFVADGHIAGLGTYDELLRTNPAFRELARASR
jgi:ATP-binding cassette, subfamily B, bacterial PglK